MSTKKNTAALVLAACLVSGCATRYASLSNPLVGWMGGYWDAKGPGDLIKVGFAGNSLIDRETVGNYLLYHCAQVAQERHKPYFALYDNLPSAIADRRSSAKTALTIAGKPTVYAYILLFDTPGPGLLSASEVIGKLKPLVDKGSV